MQLLLATTNKGKLAEMRVWLGDSGLSLLDLSDIGSPAEPDETGDSFAANARQKACAYSRATGVAALADDSGLVVEALNGRPGVHSARLAETDGERIQTLLELMRDVEPQRRQGAFVCAMCLCLPDGRVLEVEGRVDGIILTRPRGEAGFGYDPVFFFPPLNKTFAELDSQQKNQISHRADALARLAGRLRPFLSGQERSQRTVEPGGPPDR